MSTGRLAGKAEKTPNQYEYVLNGFGEYLGENPELDEITSSEIRGYMNHLFERDLANTTVAIHYRVMRVFFNWWKAETELVKSPMRNVSEPATPDKFPRILNRISKRAGMEDAGVSPHVLRHTSATMAVENGLDAFALKKQFGGEDIETAHRYVHMSGNRLEKAYKKSSPMDHFGKKSGRKKNDDDDDQRGWVNG